MCAAKSSSHVSICLAVLLSSSNAIASGPLCEPHPNHSKRFLQGTELARCQNNVWYNYNDSDTVFVFVHGILSDSRSGWFHDDPNPQNSIYWPELVRTDSRFGNPSIFLGGFYTEIGSGIYDIRAASNDLLDALNTPAPGGQQPALSKKNIVFITHSTGGIAVRHLLSRATNVDRFKQTAIGLVLVASPSLGAKDADRLALALKIGKNEMAQQLRFYNSFVKELDKDFKSLVFHKTLPYLTGTEFVENHFIWRPLGFFRANLVTEDSAARYFDEGHLIAGTDHFSIAKPIGPTHPSHQKLAAFFSRTFSGQVALARGNTKQFPKVILMDSYAKIYERKPIPGEMNSHVIQRKLQGLPLDANDIEPVHTNWNNDERIAKKDPDLIILHYSSLEPWQHRLKTFLDNILYNTTKTKIIVYSRVEAKTSPSAFNADVRRLAQSKHAGRVHGFPVYKYDSPYHTFNNGRVAEDLRTLVMSVLQIKS